MSLARALTGIAIMGAVACDGPVTPSPAPLLLVESERSFTLVSMLDRDTLAWAVVTLRDQPLVVLAPCGEWTPLGPGDQRVVPHEEVPGYKGPGTDEAVLLWCRLRAGVVVGGGEARVPL